MSCLAEMPLLFKLVITGSQLKELPSYPNLKMVSLDVCH
jgi:hypothetical protein